MGEEGLADSEEIPGGGRRGTGRQRGDPWRSQEVGEEGLTGARRSLEMGEEGLAGSEEIPGSGRRGTGRQRGDPRKWENRD